ncbi:MULTISPECIES: pro-sigmaK processing inhibitor BofA family protein [Thermoanaerobacter]|uniref:pro-sigmaK processing inhibitor BofA family protein n=1 Tax=Thermoanaerobacter TaxID=1754 RepID=UPI00048ED3EE|nr:MULTISPECIES: pro-sigmaK processing inhibitor BofA family protein [Thermoanaerobacter]
MVVEGTFSFIIAILIIIFILWILGKSLRLMLKFVLNALVGFVMLLFFNFFGVLFGVYLPVNIITSFITGVFGIAGIVILLILKYLFHVI